MVKQKNKENIKDASETKVKPHIKQVKKINKHASIKLLEDRPIYTENTSLDDMKNSNNNFYEKMSKRAFNVAFREEKENLNELINTEYHPEEEKEESSELDLMKDHLNLVS
jgi:hypothetical protein